MIATLQKIYWADSPSWYVWGLVAVILIIMAFNAVKKNRIYQYLGSCCFSNFSLPRIWIRRILPVIGTLCLLMILYRPQWGSIERPAEQKSRNLLIALDISASMLAQDISPSRLEAAKQKIRLLLTLLPSELVGLMLFAGEAFMYCPLTNDQSSFLMFLDTVDAQTISSNTTNIQSVFEKSAALFNNNTSRSNILILFTDGEDFSQYKDDQKFKDAKMSIFAVGMGTKQGAPIPIINAQGKIVGHHKNNKGKVALSFLNEDLLKRVTHTSGGIYVPYSEGTKTDMITIQQQVHTYEKTSVDVSYQQTHHDRYYYWAIAAFLCFLIDWIIGL